MGVIKDMDRYHPTYPKSVQSVETKRCRVTLDASRVNHARLSLEEMHIG